jgi:S-adenosylmethionine:tRNA ribosyltransferase-isomerase
MLQPGDLLVVNDAATAPASIRATSSEHEPIEIRLVRQVQDLDWLAALLGAGDWRTPTELRDPPAQVSTGDRLYIADDFETVVAGISEISARLVTLRFHCGLAEMWAGIYAYGRPVQYAYLKDDLALWSVQTMYASRPWAMEMPSAGRPLNWSTILELRRRGIGIASLTHAAGLSSVGHEELDDRFPLTEQFEITQETADAIAKARREDRRVIAVGTTVVRALEGSARGLDSHILPGRGETDLIIDRSFRPAVVKGILTGVHDPSQSHFRLLHTFASEATLRRAWQHASESGYLCHEFGDLCLIY